MYCFELINHPNGRACSVNTECVWPTFKISLDRNWVADYLEWVSLLWLHSIILDLCFLVLGLKKTKIVTKA